MDGRRQAAHGRLAGSQRARTARRSGHRPLAHHHPVRRSFQLANHLQHCQISTLNYFTHQLLQLSIPLHPPPPPFLFPQDLFAGFLIFSSKYIIIIILRSVKDGIECQRQRRPDSWKLLPHSDKGPNYVNLCQFMSIYVN